MTRNHASPDAGKARVSARHLITHYRFWAGLSRATSRALAERDLIGPAVEAADAAARFHRRAVRVATSGSAAAPGSR